MKNLKTIINEQITAEITAWAVACLLEWSTEEKPHAAALAKTGFWGKQGAGCLFLALDTRKLLIAHRSGDVESPNTWGTWGGAIDDGESPRDAVYREAQEESGYKGDMNLIPLYVFKHKSGFQYHNFLAIIPKEFKPKLDWETQGFRWCTLDKLPKPLHPGLKMLLADTKSFTAIQKAIQKGV